LREVVERYEKLENKLEREFQALAADLRKTHDPGILKFIKSSITTRGTTIERIMALKSARYHFSATLENDPAQHFRRVLIDEAMRNALNLFASNSKP
jgi:predicted house-cleaning noncanonical NTP pyrophosphatase (MazG superfamily)